MDLNELREFLSKTSVPQIIFKGKAQKRFIEYYREAFGVSPECSSCPETVLAEINKLKEIANTGIIMSELSQFKFKKGGLVKDETTSRTYNAQSKDWSDELAVKILKAVPAFAKQFSSMPANWKELVDGNTEAGNKKKSKQSDKE